MAIDPLVGSLLDVAGLELGLRSSTSVSSIFVTLFILSVFRFEAFADARDVEGSMELSSIISTDISSIITSSSSTMPNHLNLASSHNN